MYCVKYVWSAQVQLEVPLARETAKWIMGLNVSPSGRLNLRGVADGQPAVCYRFSEYGVAVDSLNVPNLRSSIWLGKPAAGLRVKFKGPHRSLLLRCH